MGTQRDCTVWGLLLVFCLGLTMAASAEEAMPGAFSVPAVFAKAVPENVKDLKDMQSHVQKLVDRLRPCVVGVRIGASQGSGVIINKEGFVLTAGHVSGVPEKEAWLLLTDGRRVKGKTLGANRGIDSGLIQITDKGEWPCVDMGQANDLKPGHWCLAIGHPGGVQPGRTPVVRLGRILENHQSFLRTDCALVGGDSGGPLFDMQGKVIGIHSRIGPLMTFNIHVPVDTYKETWARLVKGETWGELFASKAGGYLGIELYQEQGTCKIRVVAADSPAAKAGLKNDDVVTMFDGKKIATIAEFSSQLRSKPPGSEVTLQVQRGEDTMTMRVVLGKRPS